MSRLFLFLQGEELKACIRERERAVRQWGVGRDFADSLGHAHRGLAGKLQAVEGVLSTKLDRVSALRYGSDVLLMLPGLYGCLT